MDAVMEERCGLNPLSRTEAVAVPELARVGQGRGTAIDRQPLFQSPACWHPLRCWTEV